MKNEFTYKIADAGDNGEVWVKCECVKFPFEPLHATFIPYENILDYSATIWNNYRMTRTEYTRLENSSSGAVINLQNIPDTTGVLQINITYLKGGVIDD